MYILYYQLFRFRLPALFPCSFPPIDFIGPFLSSLLFLSFRLLDSPAILYFPLDIIININIYYSYPHQRGMG